MSTVTARPASVTPRLGTPPESTSRSNAKEKAKVAMNAASTTFCNRSRYHNRMNRGDSVPVAICTTSTPIVTTRPSSPIMAPATAESRLPAVDAE